MIDINELYKAGTIPTIIILGGISYVGILLLTLLYYFVSYIKKFFA